MNKFNAKTICIFGIFSLMGNWVFAQYTGSAPFCHENGGIFINEISQGQAGPFEQKEYVELVVVGAESNPIAPVNLEGWILDDNNFPASGEGNAPGHVVFGSCYNAVPPGSIIVIYNADDRNPAIPEDDPTDSNQDGVYIIPHLDPCLNICESNPTISTPLYCPCTNLIQPNTNLFNMRNSGDLIQIRDRCETLVHAIHWGDVSIVEEMIDSPVDFSISAEGQSAMVIQFVNSISNDWMDISNYENVGIAGNETPGIGNSNRNQDFIDLLRVGITGCNGTIFDCRDTDAGDLIPPNEVTMVNPIEICSGDDLTAFSSSYEAPDEFAPDAEGFTFEYAFLLTQNNDPTYTLIDFNSSGDFDFAGLELGTYAIWGFSFIQTNGSIDILNFLNDPSINSVQSIQNFMACGFDANVDNLDLNNDPMVVQVIEAPIAFEPTSLPEPCDFTGTTFDLTSLDEQVNAKAGFPVNWFLDQEGNSPIEDPSNFPTNGTTTVFASVGSTCTSSIIAINLNLPSPLNTEIQIVEGLSCEGSGSGVIELEIDGGTGPFNIDWNDDRFDQQQVIFDIPQGVYAVTVTDDNGCVDSTSVNLGGFEDPIELFCQTIESSQQGSGNGTVQLIYQGGTPPYTLDIEGPIESSSILGLPDSQIVNNLPSGFYTFTLTDINNCEIKCQTVIDTEIIFDVYIPNVFSPNGDAINDFLYLQSVNENLESITLFEVFDRWGSLVFQRTNFQPNDESLGWDGTNNGEVMKPGVFVYYAQVKFKDGLEGTIKGAITLVR